MQNLGKHTAHNTAHNTQQRTVGALATSQGREASSPATKAARAQQQQQHTSDARRHFGSSLVASSRSSSADAARAYRATLPTAVVMLALLQQTSESLRNRRKTFATDADDSCMHVSFPARYSPRLSLESQILSSTAAERLLVLTRLYVANGCAKASYAARLVMSLLRQASLRTQSCSI